MSWCLMPPDVSVIVPVYQQGRALAACLAALRIQIPAATFEVIVIDNGSVPAVQPWDCIPFARVKFVQWAREETPGSYAARNRGYIANDRHVI